MPGGEPRPATPEDLASLPVLEVAAGRIFAAVGMAAVGEYPPPRPDDLRAHQRDGRLWVVDRGGHPVGYLMVGVLDGCGHVEQVSLHPDHAGHGIGAALVEHAAGWATERGLPALTLTTFADVPWNAPYYERLGFRRLGAEGLTPGLRDIRAREAAIGLDRWPRCCMRRDLPALP